METQEVTKDEVTEQAKEYGELAHAVIGRCWADLYKDAQSPATMNEDELFDAVQDADIIVAFPAQHPTPIILAGESLLVALRDVDSIPTACFRCDDAQDWARLLEMIHDLHGEQAIERNLIRARSLDCWSES